MQRITGLFDQCGYALTAWQICHAEDCSIGIMGRRRRWQPPFEMEVTALGPRATGLGEAADGRTAVVRGAAPGSRVLVRVTGRKKGVWQGRRVRTIRPAAAGATPPCPVFGLCGGCALQELDGDAQRAAKADLVRRLVAPGEEVRVHPVRGGTALYGYRNKVELSFGPRRYLDDESHAAGASIDGRFLGFRAPGRFDRVVDTDRCWLVDEGANTLLGIVREHALHGDAPPPWCNREHVGFWRHLILRSGQRTGERLVVLVTGPVEPHPQADACVEALAQALQGAALADGSSVVGVVWWVEAGVADVARGDLRRQWGRDGLTEQLGEGPDAVRCRLSARAFFQTNTLGAEVLYDTVGEALSGQGTLLDLYCGTGAIGLYLGRRFARVLGVEEVASAVEDARANAALNGVQGTWRVAKVEQDLEALVDGDEVSVVVDPPRAGLHPKVAKRLASIRARELVYVACNPASLGRDAALLAPGWRMTDLWTVDLFPQTGHVEAVARFVPTGAA